MEKEFPWPNKPGLFCIRRIAVVDATVEGKTPDGSDNIVRHAPSVATMLAEVKDPQSIANEAADQAELDLLKAQQAVDDAKKTGASDKNIKELTTQQDHAWVQARGSSTEVLDAAIKALTERKNGIDPADFIRRNAVQDQIDDLGKAKDVVVKRRAGEPELLKPTYLDSSNVVNTRVQAMVKGGELTKAQRVVQLAAAQYATQLGGSVDVVDLHVDANCPDKRIVVKVKIKY